MPADGPYMVLRVSWSGSASTRMTVRRRVGTSGEGEEIATDVPIVGTAPDGRSVFTDTTAPTGVTFYYKLTGNTGATTGWTGPYSITDDGATWLTDPQRPWADLRLDACPPGSAHADACGSADPAFVWGGFTRSLDHTADAGLFDVLDAEHPADVFGRRKYAAGSFRFFTRGLDAIDRVYDLFTAGGPLMLRAPSVYGWHDQFIQPGTLEMTHVSRDQRRTLRQWDVPFTVVGQPAGAPQGTACANWCEVRDRFPTFADLTSSPGTWWDLADGTVLCPADGGGA